MEEEKKEEVQEQRAETTEEEKAPKEVRSPKKGKYKRKVCKFTVDKSLAEALDYKRVDILEKFITNRGKILPRRITGTSAKWQRRLVREIKKARSAGLLPFKVK